MRDFSDDELDPRPATEREITVAGCTADAMRDMNDGWALSSDWVLTDIEALRDEFGSLDRWEPLQGIFGAVVGEPLPDLAGVFFAEVFRDEIEEALR